MNPEDCWVTKPKPPKWEPGDEAIYRYPDSEHDGRRVWLVQRESLRHGRVWHFALEPGGHAAGWNYEQFFHPVPAEPEPIPDLLAFDPPLHDGQANTSGIGSEPKMKVGHEVESGGDPWESKKEWWFPNVLGRTYPAPSVATVLEGAARWWQADPTRRRVEIQGQGHSVLVWVTVLDPVLLRAHAQFLTPESAETTHDILDHAAKLAHKFANLEYVNARNTPMRFPLESGATEP